MTTSPLPEEAWEDDAASDAGQPHPQTAEPAGRSGGGAPEHPPATPVRLSRRALLAGAGAAAVTVAAGGAGVVLVRRRRAPATPAEARLESIRKIGRAHLDATPEDRDVDRLRAAMPSAWHRAREAAGDDPWPPLQAVAAQAREDLEAQRLVRVDGWVLAVTSARAAALVALEG